MSSSAFRDTTPLEEDWDSGSPGPSAKRTVAFPSNAGSAADGSEPATPRTGVPGKRTLSELLQLYAQGSAGTHAQFTPEEAAKVAEALGKWINHSSSPYEPQSSDDDFARSQDDSALHLRSRTASAAGGDAARPRGQSESVLLLRSSTPATPS